MKDVFKYTKNNIKTPTTFDEYCALEDELINLENMEAPSYPSNEAFDEIITPNLKIFIPYLIWVYNCAEEPANHEEVRVRKKIKRALNNFVSKLN